MNNIQILTWIKKNLAGTINQALAEKPGTGFTEDWLAAITLRETGELIAKRLLKNPNLSVNGVAAQMTGDYSQRPGDKEKCYHGFGFIQVDIGSFPLYVASGDWKDPLKCYRMGIAILQGKQTFILNHKAAFANYDIDQATTAAYNCGEGNVLKAVRANLQVDHYTTEHNYSTEVWQFRELYKTIP